MHCQSLTYATRALFLALLPLVGCGAVEQAPSGEAVETVEEEVVKTKIENWDGIRVDASKAVTNKVGKKGSVVFAPIVGTSQRAEDLRNGIPRAMKVNVEDHAIHINGTILPNGVYVMEVFADPNNPANLGAARLQFSTMSGRLLAELPATSAKPGAGKNRLGVTFPIGINQKSGGESCGERCIREACGVCSTNTKATWDQTKKICSANGDAAASDCVVEGYWDCHTNRCNIAVLLVGPLKDIFTLVGGTGIKIIDAVLNFL